MQTVVTIPPEVCPPNPDEPDTVLGIEFAEPTAESPFYSPIAGELSMDDRRDIEAGQLLIGAYRSQRASHRVGVYIPDDAAALTRPVVLMSGPLGTAAKGHNQDVAEQMMREGFVVIHKGVPRYHSPRPKALSLAEDANEMFGALNAVGEALGLDNTDEIVIYGESQAAMKAVGNMAIAEDYDRTVVDGLIVAACFFRKINIGHIHRQPERLIRMGAGVASFIMRTTPEIRERLKGTFNLKDLHHHVTVIPVLISGETGEFVPHIPTEQKFTYLGFGRDGNSHPYKVQDDIMKRFPNAKAIVLDSMGHVDGIKSEETSRIRQRKLADIRSDYS